MKNAQLLAKRFREVILDGTWIANTNYKDQLSSLSWQQATLKFEGLNTIAILTFHIHYYIAGVLNVFRGGSLDIKDKYSFDIPAIESQADWDMLLDTFWKDSEEFAACIEQMSDETLQAHFVEEKYGTFQRNIDGMIEHAYYHLGQVVILKKMLQKTKA